MYTNRIESIFFNIFRHRIETNRIEIWRSDNRIESNRTASPVRIESNRILIIELFLKSNRIESAKQCPNVAGLNGIRRPQGLTVTT